jgi:hypothetical protein
LADGEFVFLTQTGMRICDVASYERRLQEAVVICSTYITTYARSAHFVRGSFPFP